MNLNELEKEILRNRGNVVFLDSVILKLTEMRRSLDWQLHKFLDEKCQGINGLKSLDLDTGNPLYRYYNFKCGEYEQVERLKRVAEAYK